MVTSNSDLRSLCGLRLDWIWGVTLTLVMFACNEVGSTTQDVTPGVPPVTDATDGTHETLSVRNLHLLYRVSKVPPTSA